jgi:hypothetical protein
MTGPVAGPIAAKARSLLCSALVACGAPPGAAPGAPAPLMLTDSPQERTSSTQDARRHKAGAARAPLLLSPFGAMPPPPPEAVARTRRGLYSTQQQAEALERQLGGDVVWIDVDCCIGGAVERAQGQVAGLMAAQNLPADAPVFVTGAEPALAARAVDALSDEGLTRVFLVSPR